MGVCMGACMGGNGGGVFVCMGGVCVRMVMCMGFYNFMCVVVLYEFITLHLGVNRNLNLCSHSKWHLVLHYTENRNVVLQNNSSIL